MLSLVADTNVLFSYFNEKSSTKGLFPQTMLYAPERAFEEIKKHEQLISEKNGLSKKEFHNLLASLHEEVIVIGIKEYTAQLKECSGISDQDDVSFVALAYAMDTPLWTNDKALQSQRLALVVPTRSVMRILAKGQPWIFCSDKDEEFLSLLAKTKAFKKELREMEDSAKRAHKKAFG